MGKPKNRKCIVHGCENRTEGVLCVPCYEMITTGRLGLGNTFIHTMIKSTKGCLIDEVIEWSSAGVTGTEDQWEGYLARYLKQKGWDEIAIEDFVKWGEYGFNNEILHFTTESQEFFSEVEYCSE